jgi:hypothetical protein
VTFGERLWRRGTKGGGKRACRAPLSIYRTAFAGFLAVSGLALASLSLRTADSGAIPSGAGRGSRSVPSALASARKLPEKVAADTPLTLTLVLNRADQQGFDAFLRGVQDPQSPTFQRYLSPVEQADRFGPSLSSYDAVRDWLGRKGFAILEDSVDRLTLTVRGTRAQAEETFRVHLDNYQIADRNFYANDTDPALPAGIAPHVQAVVGLSNLAQPVRARGTYSSGPPGALPNDLPDSCWIALGGGFAGSGTQSLTGALAGYQCIADELNLLNLLAAGAAGPSNQSRLASAPADDLSSPVQAPSTAAGAGQKVGLVQFDNFNPSDVRDFLTLIGHPDQFGQLSQKHVAGGAGPPGADESEVLLDIDTVMSLAPGANVIVYDGPFHGRGSFQAILNAMINDHVNVISNSWAYCEDQTTLADVQSIESILATAATAGITVVSGAGDQGSTCLNGSTNTAHVPASAPHITAVGGTTAVTNVGGTYGQETWWNSDPAPGGAGGFGVSGFFPRPAYQNGLTTSPRRTIPDVTAPADPATGYFLCQQSAGGCPTNLFYGGTSVAAPAWAAFAAVLNERGNHALGFLNPLLYPLANTNAFHSAAELGSDFAHVGLGSPNLGELHLALSHGKVGAVNASKSTLGAFPPTVLADGKSKAGIVVTLVDSSFNGVSGQTVQVTMNSGSHAVLTPINSVSNVSNGAALFSLTDTQPETITLTATANGLKLAQHPTVTFVSAPAAAGGITASPTTVTANDSAATTITVTLKDSHGKPAPGKLVNLSQGNGASTISTTNGTTDATGKVQFTAVDAKAETVTYTAVDVTDRNLSVPGSATVKFVNASGFCAGTNSFRFGTAAPGYAVTTFASNFPLDCFTGIGPIGIAFDANNNLLVGDAQNNNIYSFGRPGGTAGPATLLGNVFVASAGSLSGMVFTADGRFYSILANGNKVVEINPASASVIRVVAQLSGGSRYALAVDPVSGDLFASGFDGIERLSDYSSGPATVTHYVSGDFDGIVFAGDGTLYAAAGGQGGIYRINGTNSPAPGVAVAIAFLSSPDGIALESNPADASKPFLYVNRNNGIITRIDTSALPATPANPCGGPCSDVYTGGSRGDFVTVGNDGCLYATQSERVIKLTKADGTCGFKPTNVAPQLLLAPVAVKPSPAQGTPVTFTASFKNATVPADLPVTFFVTGANPGRHLVRTDANGKAPFTYAGIAKGSDELFATAEVNGVLLTSNQVAVNWVAGKHTSFISLNKAPGGGAPNVRLKLTATLQDVSTRPAAAVVGGIITFNLADRSCSGVTDSTGTASCSVTPTAAAASYPLTASFAGTSQLLSDSASKTVDLIVTPPHQLLNISTRMRVLTGENALIGGFIVTGTEAKKVIIRGLGPGLSKQGVPGALQDPTIELHRANGSVTTNDDWKDSQRSEIEATTIPPSDDREAAIVATLPPGNYTAILAGKGGTTGVGLVEVYDISQPANAKLANISTRGFVDVGANVMIGGFIAGPSTGTLAKVLLRALGPSLAKAGVAGALQDTILELHNPNGAILATNDNWKESQQADIKATGIPPTDDRESAIVTSLAPGKYTAVVRGKGGATGVGLVEVYNLP